jgi:hypothetical protein
MMLAPLPDPDQWCDDNAERPWLLAATPPTDLQKRVRAPAATNSGLIVRYPDRSRYWVRQVTKAPLRSAMAALSFSFPISISRIPEYNGPPYPGQASPHPPASTRPGPSGPSRNRHAASQRLGIDASQAIRNFKAGHPAPHGADAGATKIKTVDA